MTTLTKHPIDEGTKVWIASEGLIQNYGKLFDEATVTMIVDEQQYRIEWNERGSTWTTENTFTSPQEAETKGREILRKLIEAELSAHESRMCRLLGLVL